MTGARLSFYILSSLALIACSSKKTGSTASSGRVSPTYEGPPETAYCATPITYSGSTITVSGTAKFNRREVYNNPVLNPSFEGLGSSSLSHPTLPATEHPIRAAEVRVTDPSGAVVQCGQTDFSTGAFSIVLPAGGATYTLAINSRSARFNGGDTYLNASVLNKPEANQFYSLTSSVNAAGGNVNLGILRATAETSGAVLGAAFNILDQLFTANDFLRTEAGSCASNGCTAVTLSAPIPKVSAYWEKGFNPNSYFSSRSGLSFYLPHYSRLFILGGQDGDLDSSDTDHFDNSVIIHEYGHFLEDSMFKSDSPGGSHNGNRIIDPRLAWSEGWGNFIQAAVLTTKGTMTAPRYNDTIGNVDGSTDLPFQVDLENMTGQDIVVSGQGEGAFREFGVSRFLMDVMDGSGAEATYPSGTDNINDNFGELWAALTKTSGSGFRQTTLAFRNIGHMQIAQQNLSSHSNWAAIRTGNYQKADNSEYAQYVTTVGTCATLSTINGADSPGPQRAYRITPSAATATSSYSASNLFTGNDFYHLKIATAGSYTIVLSYQGEHSGSQKADLDLYLYNEDAVFANSSDVLGHSTADPANATATSTETETITVSLQPGNYLINVNAYTGTPFNSAGATQYSLQLNGVALCPDSL